MLVGRSFLAAAAAWSVLPTMGQAQTRDGGVWTSSVPLPTPRSEDAVAAIDDTKIVGPSVTVTE